MKRLFYTCSFTHYPKGCDEWVMYDSVYIGYYFGKCWAMTKHGIKQMNGGTLGKPRYIPVFHGITIPSIFGHRRQIKHQ